MSDYLFTHAIKKHEKSCRKKKSFTNKKAAEKSAMAYGQKAYLCPICHTYHLTSQTKVETPYVGIEAYMDALAEIDEMRDILERRDNVADLKMENNNLKQAVYSLELKLKKSKARGDDNWLRVKALERLLFIFMGAAYLLRK